MSWAAGRGNGHPGDGEPLIPVLARLNSPPEPVPCQTAVCAPKMPADSPESLWLYKLNEFVGKEMRSKVMWRQLLNPQVLTGCDKKGETEVCTNVLGKLWAI